jgi:peptidoglycan/LPS O-acetylase OafA/YrhL
VSRAYVEGSELVSAGRRSRDSMEPLEAHTSKRVADNTRLPALTGLRMLAALAVYASHLGPPHNAPAVLRTFFASGYVGITLFFVLSGFVLALNYFDELRSPKVRSLWDYAVARIARIYPLYIAIVGYILIRGHAFGEDLGGWWEHVLMVQAWSPSILQAYKFDGPSWSISVELFLYACFPVLVVLLARVRTLRALSLLVAVTLLVMTALTAWFVSTGRGDLSWLDPGSAQRWLYRTPLTRLGDFVLGILTARIYLQVRSRAGAAGVGYALTVIAVVVTVCLMSWTAVLFTAWSWDLLYMLPAALVIAGLAISPASPPARVLASPLLVLLGESSYAFYLIHKPMMEYLGAGRWAVGASITTIVYEALTLGVIICTAVGLHIVLERPARRKLRHWAGAEVSTRQSWHGPREVMP